MPRTNKYKATKKLISPEMPLNNLIQSLNKRQQLCETNANQVAFTLVGRI